MYSVTAGRMLHPASNNIYSGQGHHVRQAQREQTSPYNEPLQIRSFSCQDAEQPRTSACFDWNVPTNSSFRPTLPPTPQSPSQPTRPWSEDEKLSFPCLGGPDECWNAHMCPEHRQYTPTDSPRGVHSRLQTFPDASLQAQREPHLAQPRNHDGYDDNTATPRTADTIGSEEYSYIAERRRSSGSRRPSLTPRQKSHSSRPSTSSSNIAGNAINAKSRVPHNLVERRYRDNLNHQIESLRMVLPSLRDAQPSDDCDEGSAPRMPSKAIIISTAATYVRDLERERDRLLDANQALVAQVASLQKLMMCGDGSGGEYRLGQYLNAMRVGGGGGHL